MPANLPLPEGTTSKAETRPPVQCGWYLLTIHYSLFAANWVELWRLSGFASVETLWRTILTYVKHDEIMGVMGIQGKEERRLFVAQRYQRINSRGSTCGPVTREQRNDNQHNGYTAEDRRICGSDTV